MNTAIVIFGSDNVGGGEKRLARLFVFLNNQKNLDTPFYLITNDLFYNTIKKHGIINNLNNVIFLKLSVKKSKGKILDNKGKVKRMRLAVKIKQITKKYILISQQIVQLIFIIKKYKISCFYTHPSIYAGSSIAILKKLYPKIRLVTPYIDSTFQHLSNNIFSTQFSYYSLLKCSDHIDFMGNYYLEGLKSRFNKKIYSYSVAPRSFIETKNITKIDKKNLIVFAGRFDNYKQPMLLLEAINNPLLKKNSKGYRFGFYGNGTLLEKMHDFIKKNNLERIAYIDYSYNLINILASSKIFVSLQKNENYQSQVLMEAMFCKNAIVATNVGETHLLINNEYNGFLIDSNPKTLAEKIKTLINDSALCQIYGERSHDLIKKQHSIEVFAEYFKDIIKKNSPKNI